MSKHIDLAKKLLELARKGVGGEKINAEKFLQDLLDKHNLTIEDIEGEKVNDHYFNLPENEMKLFAQIKGIVNRKIKAYGPFEKKIIKKYGLPGNFMITCTVAEFVEIQAKHEFYQRLYESELQTFWLAFLTANNLFVIVPEEEYTELTDEQILQRKRAALMALGVDRKSFTKQLKH